MTDREIRFDEIKKLRSEGKTYKAIGKLLGISKQRVHQILKGIRPVYKKLSKEEAHKKWLRTKERKIAYNKEWRKRNPKKNTEYVRRWEKKHLTIEQIREQRRKSYYRNRNKRLKQHADKYRNDPLWKELRIEREKQRYIRQSL